MQRNENLDQTSDSEKFSSDDSFSEDEGRDLNASKKKQKPNVPTHTTLNISDPTSSTFILGDMALTNPGFSSMKSNQQFLSPESKGEFSLSELQRDLTGDQTDLASSQSASFNPRNVKRRRSSGDDEMMSAYQRKKLELMSQNIKALQQLDTTMQGLTNVVNQLLPQSK